MDSQSGFSIFRSQEVALGDYFGHRPVILTLRDDSGTQHQVVLSEQRVALLGQGVGVSDVRLCRQVSHQASPFVSRF